MADFCLQCNREIFRINKSDLGGITSIEDQKEGKYCLALCEGCGLIQVDNFGACMGSCLRNHGIPK